MGRVEKRSALQLLLAQDKDRGAVAKVRQVLLIGHWVLSTLALNESEAGVELCFVRNLTSFKHTSFSYAYELHRGFYQKEVDANLASTNNGPVLLFKTFFRRWSSFPTSVATDGKDGHGLKQKRWANLKFQCCGSKSHLKINYYA